MRLLTVFGIAIFFILFFSACGRAVPFSTPTSVLFTPTLAPRATNAPTLLSTEIPISTETPAPTISATTTASRFNYDKNPRAILIEADVSGGFAPVPRDVHVPTYRLYADGFVVFASERANPASGLDAVVRTGYLADAEIQSLLNSLQQLDFFSLGAFYQPKPTPTDLPTWRISVYLNKTKTVSVYAAGFPGTPQNFSQAFARITQTTPTEQQIFTATDGFLQATSAGSTNDLGSNVTAADWQNVAIKLADATDGVTIAGNLYAAVAALIAQNYPNTLYREGDRVYRVRFLPNLPRAVHLTNYVGAIVDAPREFDGRTFDLVGYFRGANILGEAQTSAPKTKSDWVIADESGAMYVTGIAPTGLDLNSPRDVWNVVRLRAVVVYVRSGTSYLEARRVENLPTLVNSTPTPAPFANADAAIAAIKSRFAEVAKINKAKAGIIGGSTDITVIERSDGWDIVFWEGWEDCPAGCINNRYYYFSAKKNGTLQKMGEYVRVHNAATNSFDVTGAPMWGVPKP